LRQRARLSALSNVACYSTKFPSQGGAKNSELRFFLHVEKTKILLDGHGKFLMDRLRPTLYIFIFTFPELDIHDFSLAPHQNIDITAK
jgi:hypothetical protein